MKMRELERLCTRFRNAIDTAYNEKLLTRYYPFNSFPKDCCEHTCDLLAQYLHENGIETLQINGTCRFDESWHHVWLETMDGVLIDITGDQFNGKIEGVQNVEAVHVGVGTVLHKVFCRNKKNQPNTIFVDPFEGAGFYDSTNPRHKRLLDVYLIINDYL